MMHVGSHSPPGDGRADFVDRHQTERERIRELQYQWLHDSSHVEKDTSTRGRWAPDPFEMSTRPTSLSTLPPAPRESTWAVWPTVEEVYKRLEEFFPEHNPNKPMMDAPLAFMSPTGNDLMPGPPSTPNPITPPAAPNWIKHKRSIRILVNEEERVLDK
jgi:hypothetical protein